MKIEGDTRKRNKRQNKIKNVDSENDENDKEAKIVKIHGINKDLQLIFNDSINLNNFSLLIIRLSVLNTSHEGNYTCLVKMRSSTPL